MSHLMTKPTKWLCAQWRLRSAWACAQSHQSSLCAQWLVAKDQNFLHADSEDSDQTGQIPRLIWVFAGRTCHFVAFVMRRLISVFSLLYYYHKNLKYWDTFNYSCYYLRNRSALAVICWVTVWMSVVKKIKSRAQSLQLTDSELLLNNSHTKADLFQF